MKLMRLALCAAVFALVGGIAFSEDMDIRALQAKLAAQEARLNDLQAKMGAKSGGGTADNVVSLRKNAKVVIGGDYDTRIVRFDGKLEQRAVGGDWNTASKVSATNLRMGNVKMRMQVDVNDYFDAYFRYDFQQGDGDTNWKQAQTAWVRWKNLCNSGFSIKVGRDGIPYGAGTQHGAHWDGYMGGAGEGITGSKFGGGNFDATRIASSPSRTTQATATWQNPDGTFVADLSYFMSIDTYNGSGAGSGSTTGWDRDGGDKLKSRNAGFGSGAARLTWKGIPGLQLVGSIANQHNDFDRNLESNHTAARADIIWSPSFAPGFKIWGQYSHDWNAGWNEDVDIDIAQIGISYRFPKVNVYALGEYMKGDNWGYRAADIGDNFKSKSWAFQTGFKYYVGYGVDVDVGYRFEKQSSKDDGFKYVKAKMHAIHARLNFNF